MGSPLPKSTPSPQPGRSAGSSLVGILVALAILGILSAVAMTMFKNNLDTVNKLAKAGDFEDMRNYFRSSIDCAKTFATQGCEGKPVRLLSKGTTSREIVPLAGAKVGQYNLAASCTLQDGIKAIQIHVRGGKAKDAEPLFKIPFPCP